MPQPLDNLIDQYDLYEHSESKKTPAISVVISTYNRSRKEESCESLLKRAIESILNQEFTDFELILIDDCSTDSTADYCQKIARLNPRVRFYHFKQNSKTPAKRYNFGMSVSRGKYITFMFDDDELELNALKDLHNAIEGPFKHCGMVYGTAICYYGVDRSRMEILGGKWDWRKINSGNFIANNSVIVKRSVINQVGGYDEDPIFYRLCDWDLWWRIGRKFPVDSIPNKVGIIYGELPDSIGITRTLDWDACRNRQRSDRILPLQSSQKEPFRCKAQSYAFDLYFKVAPVVINIWMTMRAQAKQILPSSLYLFVKKSKKHSRKIFFKE